MAEPIPPPATLDDSKAQVAEAIRNFKRFKSTNDDEARVRSCSLIELQEAAADAEAAKPIANGNGHVINGHMPCVATSVATHLSAEFITELAKGLAPLLAPYVKDFVAE